MVIMCQNFFERQVVGGSWVVISGVISRVTIIITHIRGLITPLVTTHEPSSIPYTLNPKPCAFKGALIEPLKEPLFRSLRLSAFSGFGDLRMPWVLSLLFVLGFRGLGV